MRALRVPTRSGQVRFVCGLGDVDHEFIMWLAELVSAHRSMNYMVGPPSVLPAAPRFSLSPGRMVVLVVLVRMW